MSEQTTTVRARPVPPSASWPTAPGVVAAGILIGFVAGLIDLGLTLAGKVHTPIMEVSRDVVWMAPLLGALAGGGVCGVAALASVLVPARVGSRMLEVGLFGALLIASLTPVLYLPRAHDAALLVLAAGLATVLFRAIRRWHAIVGGRALRIGLAASLGALIITAMVGRGARELDARRAAGSLPEAARTDPNVVLVSIDTGRPFNMSLYGYERPTTPWLDSLAAESVVFDSAAATAPWTLPSHASMFTGRWAWELSTDYVTPLDASFPTLAEFMAGRGYLTVGAVANMRYTGHETGLDRGFVRYLDYPVSIGQLASSMRIGRRILNHPRLRILIQNDQHLVRVGAEEINRRALELARDDGDRPVFLFLNYFDVHEPYLPPSPFDQQFGPGRSTGRMSPLHHWLWDKRVGHAPMTPAQIQEEIDAYDGSMRYLDTTLKVLYESLLARWGRPTLFIITGDHGEEFGEHDVFDHGNSLYYPTVRIPLVIGGIDGVRRGRRVAVPVSNRDIPHTIATLIGAGDSSPFPGTSLAQWWTDEPSDSEPVFTEVQRATGHPDWFPVSRGDMVSVQSGSHRYILNGDGREELYDLDGDMWETRDLVGDDAYQEVLRKLRALVHER